MLCTRYTGVIDITGDMDALNNNNCIERLGL